MNLVVFKFVQLGDNVVFVPVIEHLRRLYPDWHVTLLTTPREAVLYAPWVTDVLVDPQLHFNASWKRPADFLGWWWQVRRRKPDACLVSMDQGNAAHLIARWSGADVRVGARLRHVRIAKSITHDVGLPADGMIATWHWEMARTLIRAVGADESRWPALPPPPHLRHLLNLQAPGAATPPSPSEPPRRGRRGPTSAGRPHIVIHAGSNQVITRWPLERFATLAERLARDCDVSWIDRHETETAALARTIRRVSPSDLREFASTLASADLFVGNNSGPMHLANALGCRGVVIAGPSAHGWDPYWYRDRWRVLRHPTLSCAPCEWATKFSHECTLTEDRLACLNYWTVDSVEGNCREMLMKASRARA
jgi:heptosyltransferase-2